MDAEREITETEEIVALDFEEKVDGDLRIPLKDFQAWLDGAVGEATAAGKTENLIIDFDGGCVLSQATSETDEEMAERLKEEEEEERIHALENASKITLPSGLKAQLSFNDGFAGAVLKQNFGQAMGVSIEDLEQIVTHLKAKNAEFQGQAAQAEAKAA